MAIRRILHPSDFSAASRPAFKRAVELAKALRGQLLLVHVIGPPPLVGEGYMTPEIIQGILRSQRDAAQRQLRALVNRARASGARVSGLVLESGMTHEQIIRAARRRRADMIVMGTHGRTGLTRLLLGSVAARVITSAPCPVLTVHA
jgi:nucleotide-binding universal stress UspA family protein